MAARTRGIAAVGFLVSVLAPLSVVQAVDPTMLTVDATNKTVTIPCKVAPRKLSNLNDIYPVEVMVTAPAPKGQKAHETVVTTLVRPSDVHKALETLGIKAGKPAKGENAMPSGPEVKISLEIPGEGGLSKRVSIESAVVDKKTGKPLPKLQWFFTGSASKKIDPAKNDTAYSADVSGTLITIFPVTDEAVFQTNLLFEDEKLLRLETNPQVLPKEGTDLLLIIQARGPGDK